jgi:hypothetical protein
MTARFFLQIGMLRILNHKTRLGPATRTYLYLFFAILTVKALVLLVDSQPAYFFGDSATYLGTATARWIPLDRSFLYGFFIRKTAYSWRSLQSLVWMQTAASAIAAWLLFFALSRLLSVRLWIAAGAGILCAIEPLQLLAERYVMTETGANILFAVHFVLILFYLRTSKLRFLLPAEAVGVLLIGFRISFLPVVLLDSVLPPLLTTPRRMARSALHIALALLVTQGLLIGYARWYGRLTHRPPALTYAAGAFFVSDFAPLIEPEDLPDGSSRDAVFGDLRLERHDIRTRAGQHFSPGGLWSNIEKEYPDPDQANWIGIETAVHAVVRQPAGVARLIIQTFFLYFDPETLRSSLRSDEGLYGAMDANIKEWLERIYNVSRPQVYSESWTKKWHLAAGVWYWFILCGLPLWPFLLLIRHKENQPVLFLCSLMSLFFLGTAAALVDQPTPRFLTTAAWFTLLISGLATELLMKKRPEEAELCTSRFQRLARRVGVPD